MKPKPEFLLKVDDCADIQKVLSTAIEKKFFGIVTRLVSDKYKFGPTDADKPRCFARSPLIFNATQWHERTYAIIKLSSRLNSQKIHVRSQFTDEIMQELQLAVFLKSAGKVYVNPTDCDPATVAAFLLEVIAQRPFKDIVFMVEVNLFSKENTAKMYRRDISDEERDVEADSWLFWNELHKCTNYHPHVEVALVLDSTLPSDETAIYRWLGETVAMLIVPHSTFMSNKSNFPVMSKAHQAVVQKFMLYHPGCRVVVEPKSFQDQRIDNYLDYLVHLTTCVSFNEHFQEQDMIRYPLQPLYDNLDNHTYEVFEKDPAKYILYQRAIEAALLDMVSEEQRETKTILVMIVGCGRGPLIRAALNASTNTNRNIKILAVEKNPSAVLLLMHLMREIWADKDITLISKDMRTMELEEKVDIIVSELLGSFGDNELSPECLDGVQHLLKPTGISIPQNSKSYLQPIMNKRIHVHIQRKIDGAGTVRKEFSDPTEVNWLSYQGSVFHIDATKELFTFVHPNKDQPIDNTRHGKLRFRSPVDCVLHGFNGYFTSQLYKNFEISILPTTHTKGMGSWYSCYFPVSKAIQLKTNDEIEIEFWRKSDEKKVWYEWRVNLPEISIIHNKDGEIHPIFL